MVPSATFLRSIITKKHNSVFSLIFTPKITAMQGAGGTEGGFIRFFMGFIMLAGGGFLFLDRLRVLHPIFGGGRGLFRIGGFEVTSGYVLIPFMFGIGMIFFNGRSMLGWTLILASLVMLIFGIITNVNLSLAGVSAFELLTMLVLICGGLGLMLSSLRRSRSVF